MYRHCDVYYTLAEPSEKGNHPMQRAKTTTFLLELPLRVDAGQASRLHAHLEVARTFYNAILGEANKRLRLMRADPAWQEARDLPRSLKQERSRAFALLRHQYGFSEYALHGYAKKVRSCSWIADHLDSTLAQTLATRAFQAVNRVCLGKAKKVRFRSRGRGIDSVEGKRNDTGLRFLLQEGAGGNAGWVLWQQDHIPALINWKDPVVCHGLKQRIKFVRLIRRKASSEHAKGAENSGNHYFVQLSLEGKPYVKPKNQPGTDRLGLDIGPATLAIFPHHATPELFTFCEELQPAARNKRRLQRKMERQRRANNPEKYAARD